MTMLFSKYSLSLRTAGGVSTDLIHGYVILEVHLVPQNCLESPLNHQIWIPLEKFEYKHM